VRSKNAKQLKKELEQEAKWKEDNGKKAKPKNDM
jgi:hypothetical protein